MFNNLQPFHIIETTLKKKIGMETLGTLSKLIKSNDSNSSLKANSMKL